MIGRAWVDGWRRVLAAPALVSVVYLLALVAVLPLTVAMHGALAGHLGSSLMAESAADGMNYAWWQEFNARATGVGATFLPTIIGFNATLSAVNGLLGGARAALPVAGALVCYVVAWLFLHGGLIDRFARQRPTRAFGFLGACGRHLGVLVRLAIVTGVVYGWLALVGRWALGDVYPRVTSDMADERMAFTVAFAFYFLLGALVLAVNVVSDYAKVRSVVEDRRSAIGAIGAALRFIARHRRDALGLYAANACTFLVVVAIWAVIAPGVTGGGVSMWGAFLVGQLAVVARLAGKLHFLASQTSLFQAHLAHAGYITAPTPHWPESPMAEAISAVDTR